MPTLAEAAFEMAKYTPPHTGREYLIGRYAASFLQLNNSNDSLDRQEASDAIAIIDEYAGSHNLLPVGSFKTSQYKPFTCVQMYNALINLWINSNSSMILSDKNTAEVLRKILLGVFDRHEIANIGYGVRYEQRFPMTMDGFEPKKMDKTLGQIIKEKTPATAL